MRVRYREEISPEKIRKIVVRATNWVGDAVLMTPSLVALRKTFPHAQITVLAKPWVLPVLENHPAVDRTMIFDKGRGQFSQRVEHKVSFCHFGVGNGECGRGNHLLVNQENV